MQCIRHWDAMENRQDDSPGQLSTDRLHSLHVPQASLPSQRRHVPDRHDGSKHHKCIKRKNKRGKINVKYDQIS